MIDQLRNLEELQRCDIRIAKIEFKLSHLPDKLNELRAHFEELNSRIAALEAQLADREKRERALDNQLKLDKSKVKKWESRLAEIRTSREYQALQREVELQKRANSGVEDDMLKLMEEAEALNGDVVNARVEAETVGAEVKQADEAHRSASAEISVVLGRETEIRHQVAARIDRTILEHYDTVRVHRQGIAVVPTRNSRCTGCNMQIPPQLFNVVQTSTTLETCPSCQRILFWEEAVLGKDRAAASSNN